MLSEVYEWSDEQIIKEFKLIADKKSSLPAMDRMIIEKLYFQKLRQGVLPSQKDIADKHVKRINEGIEAVLKSLFEEKGVILTEQIIENLHIAILPPENENNLADYWLYYNGDRLGVIEVSETKCVFIEK